MSSSSAGETLVFIGTQCSGAGQGIFAARLDEATGELALLGLAAEVERPTWLLSHPDQSILFAVSEVGNAGDRIGEVFSFTVEGDGRLRHISRIQSGGGGATHLELTPDAKAIFVANFGGGQVAAMPVADDGSLSPISSMQATSGSGPHRRQQGPHPHGVTLDPTCRFLLVPDMGADRIFIYRYEAGKTVLHDGLPPTIVPPGSGPRLIVFGRDGRFGYLLTELSAELRVYSWDADAGLLEQIDCVALDTPGTEVARSAAAITISRDGRFLYVSNRATNEIIAYKIDGKTGLLSELQRVASGGGKPWCAEITPSGNWMIVANQGSDLLTLFKLEHDSGMLSATGMSLAVPTPTGIAFASNSTRTISS